MKETVEREVKLEPGEEFVLPELGGESLPTRVFTSTYHDTPDLALARHGVTLRHRSEDGTGLWQLKLPKGVARIELELGGPPARPPLEMLALLVAYLRGAEVAPVARLRTRRETLLVGGAEILDDHVSVFEGRRVVRRFREVEIELVGGDERALRRLEKQLRSSGAGEADQRPKLLRALELPVPSEPAPVGPATPPDAALGAALAAEVRAVLVHDPGTRLGTDPEELHQLRVATRRLRAFLRVARPFLDPSWSEPLRAEIGWLGGALGPARDLDVLLDRLATDVAARGGDGAVAGELLHGLDEERTAARHTVVAALSSDRYLALLDRLEHVGEPETIGAVVPLAKLWRAEWRRTKKAFKRLSASSADSELHAARIRVKRVRYAAELAAHELGRDGRRVVGAAKKLQDVLGEHQDATFAQERIRAWAALAGDRTIAGELVELEQQRKADARAAWPEAWKALRRTTKPLT